MTDFLIDILGSNVPTPILSVFSLLFVLLFIIFFISVCKR